MTRISGHPDDDLLTKLGYGGHPTVAFLNTEGEILGRPLERTVASFAETLTAIATYAELQKRSAGGEIGLEYEFFMAEYKLMKLRGKNLVARGRALKGLNVEQRLEVDRIAIMVEVDDLVLKSMRGGDSLIPLGQRMLEIFSDDRYPNARKSANAWSVVIRYGEHAKKSHVLVRCAAGLRKNFPDDPAMQRWATSLEAKAKRMNSR